MTQLARLASAFIVVAFVVGVVRSAAGQAMPLDQVVVAWHVTIPPLWFDPSLAPTHALSSGMFSALHDAVVTSSPGGRLTNSLAESWRESADGRVYEFKLRGGLRFHNGDPVTTDDVKFSFERYKGLGASALKERVREVEIASPQTVRFHLREPWPDFMAFYATAAWVLPRKYVERVGDEGFRNAPVGAGPYRLISFKGGDEVVLEANAGYWRRPPSVKRLILKSVTETSTRLAMLRTGQADVALNLERSGAETLKADGRFEVAVSNHASTYFVVFADQGDPKSPWHDRRVRLATSLTIDRKAIDEAVCFGLCRSSGMVVPLTMDFSLRAQAGPRDPAKARSLLAEAGYPNGFEGGEFPVGVSALPAFDDLVIGALNAVGIRVTARPMERAVFFKEWGEKRLRGLFVGSSLGDFGSAAAKMEAFIHSRGAWTYVGHGDIDDLFMQQARERDPQRRGALLARIQQLAIDRVMVAPLIDFRWLIGVGAKATAIRAQGFCPGCDTPANVNCNTCDCKNDADCKKQCKKCES